MSTTPRPPRRGPHHPHDRRRPHQQGHHPRQPGCVRGLRGAHAAGPATPLHASPWSAVLFVLEGSVSVQIGDETHLVEPGGLATLPAGTPWTYEVIGEAARLLGITSGSAAGRFFAEMATAASPDQSLEETAAALASVAHRYSAWTPLPRPRDEPRSDDRLRREEDAA